MKRILTALVMFLASQLTSAQTFTVNNLTIQGTTTATNSIPLAGLRTQAAGSVVGNATFGAASPTALTMPTCSSSSSALTWASGTGFTCNTAINAAALNGVNASSYALLTGGSFTGNVGLVFTSPTLLLNDTSGSGFSTLTFMKNSVSAWAISNSSSVNFFALSRYNSSGVFVDQPISVSSVNGIVSFANAIIPNQTQGITGTNTNNSAVSGAVGEVLSFASTGTSLTNNTNANVASGTVTAGDWNCSGVVTYHPAGTTTVSNLTQGVNTTSATFGGAGTISNLATTYTTGAQQAQSSPLIRVLLGANATVFLVAQASFGVSTMTADGNLTCRRVR